MKSEALGGMATAMAIAGRAARPCDVCGRERARWYCAADEAYLCEPCDGSVHNANALASRHERVRLAPNGAPMKIDRHRKDETSLGGGEEPSGAPAATDRLAITSRKKQLKYSRTAPPTALQANPSNPAQQVQAFEVKLERSSPEDAQIYFDELPGNPSSPFDSPLREGKGEPDYAHEFMVFDDCEVDDVLSPEECEGDGAAGGVESSAGDFDTLSNTTAGEEDSEPMGAEEEKPEPGIFLPLTTGTNSSGFVQSMKEDESNHVPSLRLNYADVLNAWSDRGTLWTGGHAQTVPEDSTSDAAANPDHAVVPLLSDEDGSSAREARVNRYREKRRTRLFSKKIRYEVRKLNAERRPRMKGRFVKRSAGEQ